MCIIMCVWVCACVQNVHNPVCVCVCVCAVCVCVVCVVFAWFNSDGKTWEA